MKDVCTPPLIARLAGMAVALLVVCGAAVLLAASPAGAVTPPPEGVSIYIDQDSTTNMVTLGCDMGTLDLNRPGTQSTIVALEFGGMQTVSGTWGTSVL